MVYLKRQTGPWFDRNYYTTRTTTSKTLDVVAYQQIRVIMMNHPSLRFSANISVKQKSNSQLFNFQKLQLKRAKITVFKILDFG